MLEVVEDVFKRLRHKKRRRWLSPHCGHTGWGGGGGGGDGFSLSMPNISSTMVVVEGGGGGGGGGLASPRYVNGTEDCMGFLHQT